MNVRNFKLRLEPLVWHIGTLNPADKGGRGASYEGTGLSVSRHPDFWEAIAKLGGLPRFELTRPGARFIDAHALSMACRRQINQWGCEQGWAVMQRQFAVSWLDEEIGQRLSVNFAGEPDARQEYADMLESGREDVSIDPVIVPVGTEKMKERLRFDPKLVDASDMLLTFWGEDHTELDGVWWEDEFAPELLFAPRGVIFTRSLPHWQCRRI